jgi:DNA-directed RNA polymerase subunit RPC12/RpoP
MGSSTGGGKNDAAAISRSIKPAITCQMHYCSECGRRTLHTVKEQGRDEVYTCQECGSQRWYTVR